MSRVRAPSFTPSARLRERWTQMSQKDDNIHERISGFVQREHELRSTLANAPDDETRETLVAELKGLEVALDVCWDLLRQRDARRTADQDPDTATARPASEVEGYLQ